MSQAKFQTVHRERGIIETIGFERVVARRTCHEGGRERSIDRSVDRMSKVYNEIGSQVAMVNREVKLLQHT